MVSKYSKRKSDMCAPCHRKTMVQPLVEAWAKQRKSFAKQRQKQD